MPGRSNLVSISKNGVPIRLTEERWLHIAGNHEELAGLRAMVLETIADPEQVLAGDAGELLALRTQTDQKVLVPIYKEIADDGFVITACLTRRLASLNRRPLLWPSPESTNF